MTTTTPVVTSSSTPLEIQRWRQHILGPIPQLSRLGKLEEEHLQLQRQGAWTPSFAERVSLLRTISDTRHSLLFATTFSSKNPGQKVLLLEQAKEKLAALFTLVNSSACSEKIAQAYKDLPTPCRNRLAWAVWFNDGSPNEIQYGERKLEEQICLLKTKQPNLLYLKGDNFVEQLLFLTEQELAIEKEKEMPGRGKEKKSEMLDMAAHLEEFERLTVLYRTASFAQREELFSRASPKVKEWLTTIQKSSASSDSLSVDTPLYAMRGAHFDDAKTIFRVFAPYAKQVSVVLTAASRQEHCLPMTKNAEGIWEVATEHARPGRAYRYLIEDCCGIK